MVLNNVFFKKKTRKKKREPEGGKEGKREEMRIRGWVFMGDGGMAFGSHLILNFQKSRLFSQLKKTE